MSNEITRQSLLSRIRDPSNQDAWHEFESRYRELILRYARARGMQPADAEDIRQIVMMNLARSMRHFDYQPERGRFRDYLGRVVRNAVSGYVRRPKVAARALDSNVMAATPAVEDDPADDVWEREWVNHHFRLAMAGVRATFDQRSVAVFERLLRGDRVDRIAETFETTTQAVHKIKQRIRNRMRELVAAQIAEEDQPDAAPTE